MADDIVTQLQRLSTTLERGEGRSTVLGAAAEIGRLRDELAAWQATVRAHDALAAERADEIERLRAALADVWTIANGLATRIENISTGNAAALQAYDNALHEARRG